MTTRQHSTVDLVGYDKATGVVLLVIVEDRPWGPSGELLPDLQEKMNTYLEYLLGTGLASDYPQVAGKPVRIELHSTEAPGAREMEFLAIVTERYLGPRGIAFVWRALDDQGRT